MNDQEEATRKTSRWPIVILQSPWVAGALLALFAFFYYGSYYRSGLNLGGEGGTVAVYALRLLEGQRPLVDTFLGYNVMWFYPVAWLFQITGPDYIALRLYFFAMCLVTALMGYAILWWATRLPWYAFAFALLLILIPGMIFRNYMGFLTVLNLMTMVFAVFWHRSARWKWGWTIGSGVALGLTYLVRIDLGIFFTLLWCGLAVLMLLRPSIRSEDEEEHYVSFSGVMVRVQEARADFPRRFFRRLGQLALVIGVAFAVHLPFYLHAVQSNYHRAFLQQYSLWTDLIRYNLQKELAGLRTPAPPAAVTPQDGGGPPASVEGQAAAVETVEAAPSVLQRRPLSDIGKYRNFRNQAAVLSLYLPILSAILLVSLALGGLIGSLCLGDREWFEEAALLLVATGAGLTLFPQYFFFRPDPPHLSEFMVPFTLAIGLGGYLAFFWTRWINRPWAWAIFGVLALAFSFHLVSYAAHCLGRESAGSWGARTGRSHELIASNGVRVFLTREERDSLQAMHDLIVTSSQPGEYVPVFPYSPTINFMTDRPSYFWNLYVDDVTAFRDFNETAVADLDRIRPPVVVVDNRDINRTEFSRFRNWAAPVYDFILRNYSLAKTFGTNEIYLINPDFRGDLPTDEIPGG